MEPVMETVVEEPNQPVTETVLEEPNQPNPRMLNRAFSRRGSAGLPRLLSRAGSGFGLPQVISEKVVMGWDGSPRDSDEAHTAAPKLELNYDTFGDKRDPAVLLIMGLTSQKLRFPKSFCRDLAREGHYVIRFDNRDVGGSTRMLTSHLQLAGMFLWSALVHLLKEWAAAILVLLLLSATRAAMQGRFMSLAPAYLAWSLGLLLARWHRPPVPYTVADQARDALALLDALEIPAAHIVGFSMGGMIAQFIAHHRRERVLSLSLVSTCPPTAKLLVSPGIPSLLRLGYLAGVSFIPGAPKAWRAHGTAELWLGISGPGQREAQHELALQEHDRSSQDLDAFARQILAILDFCSGDEHWAPVADAPPLRALVIHGTKDNMLPIGHGFALAERFKCKCVTLPVGHDTFPAAQLPIADELKVHLGKTLRRGSADKGKSL